MKILLERLANARQVTFFTGAGISAESGIATFRATDGIWSKFKPEELANVNAFLANPQMVWEWYQSRRDVVLNARPNPGHVAIAAFEELIPNVTVVTQNIDGLHTEAGSSEVLELHGNIRRNYCQSCHRYYNDVALLTEERVQECECGGQIRPDVVWFGEMLPQEEFRLAEERASESNVLFAIGTSAIVYPAAGIPVSALESGAYVVEINPESTPLTPYVHQSIRGSSGQILPQILQRLRDLKGITPLLLVLLTSLLTMIGCAKEGPRDDVQHGAPEEAKPTLTVLAAASLKNVFEDLGSIYATQNPDVTINFSFAGSNVIVQQAESGAPADVIALAESEMMNGLDSAGLLREGSRTSFASNALVLVVPEEGNAIPDSLPELLDSTYHRIAIASPGVPARIYAEETLRAMNLWDQLEPRCVFGANVRQVLTYVENGDVACGFVYASDAATSKKVSIALVIPEDLHRPILYPAAILKGSSNQEIAARFLRLLESEEGKKMLERYGFSRP